MWWGDAATMHCVIDLWDTSCHKHPSSGSDAGSPWRNVVAPLVLDMSAQPGGHLSGASLPGFPSVLSRAWLYIVFSALVPDVVGAHSVLGSPSHVVIFFSSVLLDQPALNATHCASLSPSAIFHCSAGRLCVYMMVALLPGLVVRLACQVLCLLLLKVLVLLSALLVVFLWAQPCALHLRWYGQHCLWLCVLFAPLLANQLTVFEMELSGVSS